MTEIANIVELMAWADTAIEDWAKLQSTAPLTTPELMGVVRRGLDHKGYDPIGREMVLLAMVATAVQKLSTP